MSDLKDMLGKKPKNSDQDVKEAKLNALHGLKKMASGMAGGSLKGMMDKPKEVTVAAETPEDLKAGLDIAKDMVPESDETDSMEGMEIDSDMTLAEVEKMEQQLAEMKKKLLSAKA